MSRVLYKGKKWKVIDELSHGNVVLCQWVRGSVPTIFNVDIPYFYRGVVIANRREVKSL